MEKAVKELRNLDLMRRRHGEAACNFNKRLVKHCKETLLGKCFRVKGEPHWRLINGEKYAYYICFVRLVESLHGDDEDFELEGVMISFVDIDHEFGNDPMGGVRVFHETDTASGWLYYLERAKEITRGEFEQAKHRAIGYIDDKLDLPTKGEAVSDEEPKEDGEDYDIIDEDWEGE